METLVHFKKRAQHLYAYFYMKLSSFTKHFWALTKSLYWFIVFRSNPLLVQIFYYISISFAGFLALRVLRPKNESIRPKGIDLFFMSVSTLTVSSMSTVEMEIFSNSQLWVLIILMLLGGEVFTSTVGLQFIKAKLKEEEEEALVTHKSPASSNANKDQVELELKVIDNLNDSLPFSRAPPTRYLGKGGPKREEAITYLTFVVLFYVIFVIGGGYLFISLYISHVPSASEVLKTKGIHISTFSIFAAISSFANCGFLPTNESMILFKKNPGLLLLIIPQVLIGSTLFPPCLRLVIWILKKLTKRGMFDYILQNASNIKYKHILPPKESAYLPFTVFGFVVVQLVLFCFMEWNLDGLDGLNPYQKVAGALFQSVNSRHAGESMIDVSTLSPAVLVLYMAMMYFPPYTTFLPIKDDKIISLDGEKGKGDERSNLLSDVALSRLANLVIFIILVCITERKRLLEDPLNFNVMSIAFEVISAYGNVGFSIGYSCRRRLLNGEKYNCKDAWYGFAGRWSNKGKLILILVMLFGRLKKFNVFSQGGKAWKLR